MRLLRGGDDGPEVAELHERLILLGEAISDEERSGQLFGESTSAAVRAFQGRRRLQIDGIVGPDTWDQLLSAGYTLGSRDLHIRSPYMRGDDVMELQRMLDSLGFDGGKHDGVFGPRTARALGEFQRNVGITPDQVFGHKTLSVLNYMRPVGPGRTEVLEREQVRRMSSSIEGRVVAVDISAPQSEHRDGMAKLGPVAEALLDSLVALKAKPVRVGEDPQMTPSERAEAANEAGAEICVALRKAPAATPSPVCCYFGSHSSYSPAGKLLARLLVTALADDHETSGNSQLPGTWSAQPFTGAIVRETRMPAVQIELGDDHLDQAESCQLLGEAIARALANFFEGEQPQAAAKSAGVGTD